VQAPQVWAVGSQRTAEALQWTLLAHSTQRVWKQTFDWHSLKIAQVLPLTFFALQVPELQKSPFTQSASLAQVLTQLVAFAQTRPLQSLGVSATHDVADALAPLQRYV
jgi:hypothetical protein